MSKILGISLVLLFSGMVAFGQSANTSKSSKCSSKKSCLSLEQCAAEKGMTVAECQAQCKKKCEGTKTAQSGTSKSVGQYAGYQAPATEKTAQCASTKKCVKATGMTKAECKAKCSGTKASAKNSEALHAEK